MITQQTILRQMETLVAEARQANSEQQAREKFAAIKALCDVVLAEQSVSKPQVLAPTISNQAPVFSQPVAIPAQKLHEDDANGDSLFDF